MYVDTVRNRNSRPAILLREGHREGKKVRKRTLANLTHWPADQVESLRRVLRGEKLVPIGEVLVIERAKPHGHVEELRISHYEFVIAFYGFELTSVAVAPFGTNAIEVCIG